MTIPPPPSNDPAIPPYPRVPPSSAPQTQQIPVVTASPDDQYITGTVEPDDNHTDGPDEDEQEYAEPTTREARRFRLHAPHRTTRWRLNRDKCSATYTWCQRVPDPRWYRPWRKAHKRVTGVISFEPTTGRVYARYIRRLHFRPSQDETTLRYVRRFHPWSHALALFLPWAAWTTGLVVLFSIARDDGPWPLIVTIWSVGWYIFYLTGWFPWGHTFLVVTNKRLLRDRWLPFWLPTVKSEVNLSEIMSKEVGETWFGNIVGFSTLYCGTVDSGETTRWIETGLRYVVNGQELLQCIDQQDETTD